MKPYEGKRYLTANKASKAMGVSEHYIHQLMKRGVLVPLPWSRPLQVTRSSVRRAILDRQPEIESVLRFDGWDEDRTK